MARKRDTVYDRLQRNGGFISGPRHSMIGTEEGMASTKKRPPKVHPLAKALNNALLGGAGHPGLAGGAEQGVDQEPDQDDIDENQSPSDRNPEMPVKDNDEDDVVGGGEKAAPNYRKADGMSDCAGCEHMDQTGMCRRFEFKAKPDWVCDDFKPVGDEMNGDTGGSSDFDNNSGDSPAATQ